jgi:uncharacterized protein YjiS (DUF1127 family)
MDTSHPTDDPVRPAHKRLATLRAAMALVGGHVVHQLADGGYLVTWRGHQRRCADLDELTAHARRLGAVL